MTNPSDWLKGVTDPSDSRELLTRPWGIRYYSLPWTMASDGAGTLLIPGHHEYDVAEEQNTETISRALEHSSAYALKMPLQDILDWAGDYVAPSQCPKCKGDAPLACATCESADDKGCEGCNDGYVDCQNCENEGMVNSSLGARRQMRLNEDVFMDGNLVAKILQNVPREPCEVVLRWSGPLSVIRIDGPDRDWIAYIQPLRVAPETQLTNPEKSTPAFIEVTPEPQENANT
jgi:hypothetical protein